jgi:RNA polymerase sigma-70 factor (ECF subfamily)
MVAAMPDPDDPRPLSPERIFHDHGSRVYNLARRLMGNDADAEDVTQEVLLQVVRKLDTFRGDASITTWLHRVTFNAAQTLRRRRAARPEMQTDDPLDQLFQADGYHVRPVKDWSIAPEELVLEQEQQDQIEAAVATLPEIYRDVYVLADVEQLPNAEIAEMLTMSVPAVKSRLHRARLLMREALAPYFEEATS